VQECYDNDDNYKNKYSILFCVFFITDFSNYCVRTKGRKRKRTTSSCTQPSTSKCTALDETDDCPVNDDDDSVSEIDLDYNPDESFLDYGHTDQTLQDDFDSSFGK
jgi:hypothetical protein